jgi:hypothetical protein
MKIFFAFSLIGFLLVGCSSPPAHSIKTTPEAVIPSQSAGATAVFTQLPVPSPTDIQLPFSSDTGDDQDYCKAPYAILPVGDGNDISEDEIVYELTGSG